MPNFSANANVLNVVYFILINRLFHFHIDNPTCRQRVKRIGNRPIITVIDRLAAIVLLLPNDV